MILTRADRGSPSICCACGNGLPLGVRVLLWVSNRRLRAACNRRACFDVALGLARAS